MTDRSQVSSGRGWGSAYKGKIYCSRHSRTGRQGQGKPRWGGPRLLLLQRQRRLRRRLRQVQLLCYEGLRRRCWQGPCLASKCTVYIMWGPPKGEEKAGGEGSQGSPIARWQMHVGQV